MACSLLLSGALAITPAQKARANALGNNLRCPICTGLPITESTNDLSVQMLREVRKQIAAGHSNREIYAYFTARYGNFVLLDPPKEGRNLLLWGTPPAALAAGGAVLWKVLRRRRQANESTPAAATPNSDEPFDSFLAKVRRETRPSARQCREQDTESHA
ncbi:cytochrome c-type biogenesis protein [Deinococcus multiflagellatus]|uniref:Cytochrome c-type biogenesis protein n=1 Tax=Deinococcus multiflagellatus TaxID=1656887 RepID=A0ABW1ZR17_9DEIO|nr:cytochrome c-type biogenesis protein CcmH [Deinococcus multiflagellatus]MBZ9715698.1 cytochrome c-type biogenesis protein CcmH [Deinococcus multiflagellatus]